MPQNKKKFPPPKPEELSETDPDRIQKILMNSDKMAALGQLISGVAHELNNPISFIESNVIFLEKYFGELRKLVELYDRGGATEETKAKAEELKKEMEYEFAMSDLDNVLKSFNEGASRIRSIISSLSSFSRGDKMKKEEMNIHEAIDNTINLLKHKSRHKVDFVKVYHAHPIFYANRSEINQVLMNFLINAVHAIYHKFQDPEKGTITVTTRNDSGRLIIMIQDNGEGIPEENKEKIFQAFFTTKKSGEGTGLGLPISKDLIQKHAGEILLESTAGQGTTFTIVLPIRDEESDDF